MSRRWLFLLAAIGMIGSSQAVLAVGPFIENHHHPYQSGSELGPFEVTTFTYVDIPGTTKSVTVPAGTAVIHWTVGRTNANYALIRPVIGAQAPATPPIYHQGAGTNDGSLSGSWSTIVAGGTFEVKLQAALSSDFAGLGNGRAIWTHLGLLNSL